MNSWQFTPFAWLYLAAVIISFGLTYLAWKNETARDSRLFGFMTIFTGIWSLGYLLGFFNSNPTWKMILLRVEYVGIIGTAVMWLFFTAAYSQRHRWFTKNSIILLSIIPLATFALILTVEHHNLIYLNYRFVESNDFILFTKEYGPGFYAWVAYAYVLVILGILFLIEGMVKMPRRVRWQLFPLTLVIICILYPNLIYVFGANPIHPYDPTPLSFVVSGVILIILMLQSRFLEIVPVAHHSVFQHINSGVIILDSQWLIMEMNPAAERIIQRQQSEFLGKPVINIFPNQANLELILNNPSDSTIEINPNKGEYYELQITPFANRMGETDGRILVLYDISSRKLAEEELRKQANTDPLTGVLNRRHFFELAEPIFEHARRYQRDLSAMMIDLDHFKRVNDQHGHRIGDQVLIAVADQISSQTRAPDILGRYGGEEFVILMPETSIENAIFAAERLRQQISNQPILTDNGSIEITISIGVAILNATEDTTIDRLIDNADQALYAAKQSGRNRVVAF